MGLHVEVQFITSGLSARIKITFINFSYQSLSPSFSSSRAGWSDDVVERGSRGNLYSIHFEIHRDLLASR